MGHVAEMQNPMAARGRINFMTTCSDVSLWSKTPGRLSLDSRTSVALVSDFGLHVVGSTRLTTTGLVLATGSAPATTHVGHIELRAQRPARADRGCVLEIMKPAAALVDIETLPRGRARPHRRLKKIRATKQPFQTNGLVVFLLERKGNRWCAADGRIRRGDGKALHTIVCNNYAVAIGKQTSYT